MPVLAKMGKVEKWRYRASIFPSLAGLALLLGLSLGYHSPTLPLQSDISSLVFITICIVGAIAGQFPSKIRGLTKKAPQKEEVGSGYLGHHPSCGQFDTHVLKFRQKILCAGCTGLSIGAAAAVIVTLYVLINPIKTSSLITLIVGVALAAIGILQHALGREPRIHLALNVILVLGVALARIGANQLNGGIVVDAYTLAISMYLIVARIDLSRNDHQAICSSCEEPCEISYSAKHKLSIIDD